MIDIRQQYGAVLYKLGVLFPSGNDAERRTEYMEVMEKQRISIADLREAGERIKATRDKTTFPPLAEILRQCGDARALRLRAERADSADGPDLEGRPMNPGELRECDMIMLLYNVGGGDWRKRIYWCPVCAKYDLFCKPHYPVGGIKPGYEGRYPSLAETEAAVEHFCTQGHESDQPLPDVPVGVSDDSGSDVRDSGDDSMEPLGDVIDLF